MKKRLSRLLAVCAVLLVLCAGAFGLYVSDYSRAEPAALALAAQAQTQGRYTTLAPTGQDTGVGVVFYPGGKVEAAAYLPLLQQLAEQGWLCISVKMPCYMAFFGINAADELRAAYPQVENWYIGGHSLGGAMAASYAAKHNDALSGLVLLASYSTADLSRSDLPVCSIYGSRDTVLNAESYAQNRSNLPANTTELVIEGGNHAGFGAYGPQKKDGIAAITAAEQQKITANHILGFYN